MMENRFLNFYNQVFKLETLSMSLIGTMAIYTLATLPFNMFHKKFFFNVLIMPALSANIFALYARRVQFKEYEIKFERLYKKEME